MESIILKLRWSKSCIVSFIERRHDVMGVFGKLKTLGLIVTIGLCFAAFINPLGEAGAGMDLSPGSEKSKLLPVTVYRLILDPVSQHPVVILADSVEERALPIWIDSFEANAIHSEMEGIKHRRPLTHDLLERIIQKTRATIHQIVITQLKENIYYAKIRMEVAGTFTEIDARPSDSIVVALKFKAPLFVSTDLFKDKAMPLAEEKKIAEERKIAEEKKIVEERKIAEEKKIVAEEKIVFEEEIPIEKKSAVRDSFTSTKLVGWLVSYDIDPAGIDYKLYEGKTKIGRSNHCKIIVNDSTVSEEHVLLLYKDEKFILQDELSANGTFVNGEQIEERVLLEDGDEITFGSVNFIIKII